MKKKLLFSLFSMVLVICVLFSTSVTAFAVKGTVTGVMQDTAIPDSGKLYWTYTYNKPLVGTGTASLKITGNGYMPNGTDQDWFQAEYDAGCYITEVTIGEGVKSIMSLAFAGEIYLEEITLPSTIERIGEGAFAYTAITQMHIPAKVEYLDGSIFAGSPIEKFTVASGNPYYTTYGGHIYSKDYSTFVAAASGKLENADYSVPFHKSTTAIGKFAFYNCGMTDFTVPSHVKEVKNGAFDGCGSLKNLSIQNGVEKIYDNAFYRCSALRSVHLPLSVTYLGNYSLGYSEIIDYEGLKSILDSKGISYQTLNANNYATYAELAGFSAEAFICPGTDISFTVYAAEGSVGEKYAALNGTGYVKASNLMSVQSTADGVLLQWNYSDEVSSYTVYRKKSGGSWEPLKSGVVGSATSFVDANPYQSTENIYTIRVYYNTGLNFCDKSGMSVYYVTTPKLTSIKNELNGIRINWTLSDGLKYNYVYRAEADSDSWKCIYKAGGTVKTYLDTSAKADVDYKYTVRAYDGVGLSSFVEAGISSKFVEYPKVSLKNTATGVTVSWAKISYADSYRVYRKTTGGWTVLDTVSGENNSFVDTTAKSGTTYTYTVRAISDGVYSSYVSTKILALDTPVLKKAENTVNGIKVSWGKVSGAKGYYVYRKLSDGSWKRIGNVKSGSTVSLVDRDVKANLTNTYTVIAYNGSYASTFDKNGISSKFVEYPKVSLKNTATGVTVRWAKTSYADGYRVYRKTTGGWTVLDTVSGEKSSFVDTTAKSGTTYTYAVRAISDGVYSSYVSTKILALDMPSLVSAVNTVKGVKVSWDKVSGAKGYYVYRQLSDGSWKRIGNVKSGSTVSFTDTTAQNNKKYVYTVIAYNGSYASTFDGNGIETRFVSAPKVSSAVSTKNGIKIKYNAISGADSYRIYRKSAGGSWQYLGNVKNGTTYLDKTAVKGQSYIYTVRACNGTYMSSYYSNTITVKDIY